MADAFVSVLVLFWNVMDQPEPVALGRDSSTVRFTFPFAVFVMLNPPPRAFLPAGQSAVRTAVVFCMMIHDQSKEWWGYNGPSVPDRGVATGEWHASLDYLRELAAFARSAASFAARSST